MRAVYGIRLLPKLQALKISFQVCKMFLKLWKCLLKHWKMISKLKKVIWIPEKGFCSLKIQGQDLYRFRQHFFRGSTSLETQLQNRHFWHSSSCMLLCFSCLKPVNSWLVIKTSKHWKLFSKPENSLCETEWWFFISTKCFENTEK